VVSLKASDWSEAPCRALKSEVRCDVIVGVMGVYSGG
jgi:hypothetical protein